MERLLLRKDFLKNKRKITFRLRGGGENGYKISFGGGKNVLKLVNSHGYTALYIY